MANRVILTRFLVYSFRPLELCGVAEVAVIRDAATVRLFDGEEEIRTDVIPETIITCVDCGGRAHLLTTWPDDDPPQPGDVMTYHCEDCWERLDVVLPDLDEQSQ